MKKAKWITGHWFGDYFLLELLWWIFFFPLLSFGVTGILLIIFVFALVFFLSWGKTWYTCPSCCYEIVIKQ